MVSKQFDHNINQKMRMEERMTLCNMSIEGGARVGYVNPDQKTFAYLEGKPYAHKNWQKALEHWKSIASDENAEYDDSRMETRLKQKRMVMGVLGDEPSLQRHRRHQPNRY